MKKRLVSWLLALAMTASLIPASLIPASAAEVRGDGTEYTDRWVSQNEFNGEGIITLNITQTVRPTNTLTIGSGQKISVYGVGTLSGASLSAPLFIVESGGHLVLDGVTITNNTVDTRGVVYVSAGGLLDLGYNDKSSRTAPSITANTQSGGAARNLVIEDNATVRLNAGVTRAIGISYAETLYGPVSLIQGGRYAIQASDVTTGRIQPDSGADYALVVYNDQIVLRFAKYKVLFWNPTDTFAKNSEGTANNTNWVANANTESLALWNSIANTDVTDIQSTTWDSYLGLDRLNADQVKQFDVIVICAPRQQLTENDKQKLLGYLNIGGRVYIQSESSSWATLNQAVTQVAQQLGGTFSVYTDIGFKRGDLTVISQDSLLVSGVSSWTLSFGGAINTTGAVGVTELIWVNAYNTPGGNQFPDPNTVGLRPLAVDQYAGDDGNKNRFGRLTVMCDIDAWVKGSDGPADTQMTQFATNMLTDSRDNRLKYATGENPNAVIVNQAKVAEGQTSAEYRTLSAALGKITEDGVASIIDTYQGGITPVEDELLFNKAAFEDNEGHSVKALADGTYIDVSTAQAVNIHSGRVEIAPGAGATADNPHEVHLGAALNDTKDGYEGGIKLSSESAYTLNAADPNSPILPANNGTASITLPTAGESVTATYPGGEEVTYTAQTDNDVFYLGTYQVVYDVNSNAVPANPNAHAHHAQTFTQTFTPSTGYELDGGAFQIFTRANGGELMIPLKKDEVNSKPGEFTIYTGDGTSSNGSVGKVTVTQYHDQGDPAIPGNNSNERLEIEIQNVRSDIVIKTADEAVKALSPQVTIRGVGLDKDGHEVTLYSYAANMTYTDGVAQKPVQAQIVAQYKLTGVKNGTSEDNLADGQLDGNQYKVDLTQGDQIVEFRYEWNMVTVMVEATFNGKVLGSYQLPMEKGVEATVYAPVVTGYTADAVSKTFTPSDNDKTVTFTLTQDTGNVTILVVDESGTELARRDGGTVAKGDAISSASLAPPAIEFYSQSGDPVITVGTVTVNDNTAYDGSGDITVAYPFTRNQRDLTIVQVDYDTGTKIGEKTISGLLAGVNHVFKPDEVEVPAGYTALSTNPESFYVRDVDGQSVELYYKSAQADGYAQVTVKLIDADTGEVFQSYPVMGLRKGVAAEIAAPEWRGYELAQGENNSKTIEPSGDADKDVVEFKYNIKNAKTLTIKLLDTGDNSELTAPASYVTSYTLKEGDTLTVTAPSLGGYTLVSAGLTGGGNLTTNDLQVVTAEYANLTGSNTLTFRYTPVAQANFVIHSVKFIDDSGHTFYSYNAMVGRDDATTTDYTKDAVQYIIPGYKLVKIELEVDGQKTDSTEKVSAPNNKAAAITYCFEEDSAKIIVEQWKGDPNGGGTKLDFDVELTGYRVGQTNIVVSAPARTDAALDDDLTKTIPGPLANSYTVRFQYEDLANVYFQLYDADTGNLIAVKNATAGTEYVADNGILDLSSSHYAYHPDSRASSGFQPGEDGKVTAANDTQYSVYFRKATRQVEYVAVDQAELDRAGAAIETATEAQLAAAAINGLTPAPMDDARVGETYKAVAQSFDGWTLNDQFSKLYPVADEQGALKVYFQYVKKASGTVTVQYYYSPAPGQTGQLLNSYAVQAAVGETAVFHAPEYLENGRYKLRQDKLQEAVHVTDTPYTVMFYYEANFWTVDTKLSEDGGAASAHEKYEVVKGQGVTLYPPVRAGYTLAGISGLTGGGADSFPAEWNSAGSALTFTPAADTAVTYHYRTTTAAEFQSTVTVRYRYNGYELAADRTVQANIGQASTIDIPAFEGYAARTYTYVDGADTVAKDSGAGSGIRITPAQAAGTVTITYVRPDGSVVLPGKDDKIPAPDDGDNVTVTPTDPDKPPVVDPGDGSVTIPGDTTGTVTRPDPDGGGEDEEVIVPGGTVIDPDGTIHLPEPSPGGTTIDPDGKLPDDLPAGSGYIVVSYEPGDGAGEVIRQIGEKNVQVTLLGGDAFAPPAGKYFSGWKDGGGTGYTAGGSYTLSGSMTLTAQWQDYGSGNGDDIPRRDGDGIILPGKDGKLDPPNDKDNVTVAPDKGAGGTDNSTIDPDTGKVTLPDGGKVTYPDGTEVEAPGGSKVWPDGTIEFPDNDVPGSIRPGGGAEKPIPGGSTVDPDGVVTYRYTVRFSGVSQASESVMVRDGVSHTYAAPHHNGCTVDQQSVTWKGGDQFSGGFTITFTYRQTSGGSGGGTGGNTGGGTGGNTGGNTGGTADPGATGVGDWLRYTDHSAFMNGYGGGFFGARDNLTRAQAAQIFYNLLVRKEVAVTVSFADVPADAWYSTAVHTLASLGIVNGTGDGKFAPDRCITRAEFTAIAARFARAADPMSVSPFDDVSIDDWFFGSVVTAVSYGWITGFGDGRFAPYANITRAETATIVNRMLARSADRGFVDGNGGLSQFSDVTPGDWFYYQVMEAANSHDHAYNADGHEVWAGLWK